MCVGAQEGHKKTSGAELQELVNYLTQALGTPLGSPGGAASDLTVEHLSKPRCWVF